MLWGKKFIETKILTEIMDLSGTIIAKHNLSDKKVTTIPPKIGREKHPTMLLMGLEDINFR